jgi:hypothetical protein
VAALFFSSATGYMAIFLIAYTIALPYYLRRRRLAMRPHYLIGYAIAIAAWTHSLIAMSAGFATKISLAGIDAAMAALLLVTTQVLLGLALRESGANRSRLKRLHFGVMLGIVVFVLAHVILNGALLRGILAA